MNPMGETRSLPLIPETMIVNTGDEAPIWEAQKKFFHEILGFLGYTQRAAQVFASIDVRVIGIDGAGFQPSNDFITTLVVRDCLVATVFRRRNDRNYVETSFAHYLNPTTIKRTLWEEPE